MKLVYKITLLYLSISLLVFLVGYLITFRVIKREVDSEQRRFLLERLESATRMVEQRGLSRKFSREKIDITPLDGDQQESKPVFSDTLVLHQSLQRIEPHVKLDIIKKIGDKYYAISMYDLIIEEDDIEEGLRESLVMMYLILFIVVLLLSILASYWLLKPFDLTLHRIRNFNIKDNNDVMFEETGTTEIKKLNKFLNEMTQKIRNDYQSLKEFSENASHEMQTPIAIATGKLELLLESENLKDDQILLINSAQDSIRRLSKIGSALSLLTKIENREFRQISKVNLSKLLNKLLFDFKELVELKGLKQKSKIDKDIQIVMDPTLAAILVTNLIQNAIRHNSFGGEVGIELTQGNLKIKNSGEPLSFDPEQMFQRFKKNDQSKESIGLGLAIVKKICDVNQFHIKYKYLNNSHIINIKF